LAEDDDPLFLSHGDVLCVVVPVITDGVELALKFAGDGRMMGWSGSRRKFLEPRRVWALVRRRS
jgi:hypothetical protein